MDKLFDFPETSDDFDLTDITPRIKKLNGEVEILKEERMNWNLSLIARIYQNLMTNI